MPAVVRTLPGYEVTFPVTGSPPIYTAITRDSTVLLNTTTIATVRFYEEGNYTCVATNRFGSVLQKFAVIFNDQPGKLSLSYWLTFSLSICTKHHTLGKRFMSI